jgi:hypothetical protein
MADISIENNNSERTLEEMKTQENVINETLNLDSALSDSEMLILPDDPADIDILDVEVAPPQDDEFVCSKCFLVKHSSQRKNKSSSKICVDCA